MQLTLVGKRLQPGRPIGALLGIGLALALALAPARTAGAWAIGSQINEAGCHEPITAAALRAVRARFDTAPAVPPSRDEAALFADVLFAPPRDLVHDLAGMTLMLGVRDNDLKGIDPLSSLDLIQVHGNPTTQDEHCIRGPEDDGGAAGDLAALAACRRFIVDTATEALDGLDAAGRVDLTRRTDFKLFVGVRGEVTPALPVFYIKIGAAMHALEDGFPHTYRTADGRTVTTVLNWIDLVGGHYHEAEDGPAHRAELDRCWDAADPIIHRNYELATQAATELLAAALDPGLTRAQKIQQLDAVAAKYLGYQPGCTFDNQWCDPPEAKVTNSLGCHTAGGGGTPGAWLAPVLAALLVTRRRRRRLDALARCSGAWPIATLSTLAMLAIGLATPARADDPPPATPPPVAPPPAPSTTPPPGSPDAPVPTLTAEPGKEPGRDVKTPTVQETTQVRADKQLGSRWGFAAALGGSVDRPALAGKLGGRYRIHEQWVVGLDAGWNPWITTSPMMMHAGVVTLAGTLIRRFPMKFDRVNLRSSIQLGVSTLLFDVYGAPKYSTGPYGSISPLGIDYDLGHAVRIVWDPVEIAMPVPLLGQLPLYYEQFRMMIGIQIGS
jgi:MYXO-CTERM domain-containing protein